MTRLIVLSLLIAIPAAAQDCTDWTTTMPPPVEYPEIRAGWLEVVGDLLVSVYWETIAVYRLSADHHVEALGEVAYIGSLARARVIHGELYLALSDHGLLHVNLSDPANPSTETVFDPGPRVRDIAAFNGGFAIAAEETLYAIDRLDGRTPQVLSAVAIDAHEVVAVGTHVYAVGARLSIVDFADPGLPIVEPGESHYPGDDLWLVNPSLSGLIVHGNVLYVTPRYWHYYAGTLESYTFAFDISVPMEPELSMMQENHGYGSSDTIVFDNYLIKNDYYANLEFIRLDDLEPVARVAAGAIVGNPVAYGDQLYVRATHDHTLHRLDCSHVEVVNPVNVLPRTYHPLDCGPFGVTSRTVYDCNMHDCPVDSSGWVLYDQSDPTNPTAIHEHMFDVPPDWSFNASFVAYNDNWIVMKNTWNGGWTTQSVHVYSVGGWESALIAVDNLAGVVLDGDTLWIRNYVGYQNDQLSTYQLAPGSAQLLDVVVIPGGSFDHGRLDLGHEIYLSANDVMLVYDRDSPGAITLLDERSLAPLTRLDQAGRIVDDLLFCLVPGGFAVVDLQPDSPTSPIVRSHVAHVVGTSVGLTWNGDRAMVHSRNGYQVIDISDPDAIEVVTDLVPLELTGAVWTGDHLYASFSSSTYLYDISELSSPMWLGQGEGEIYSADPCIRDGYLMIGNAVYLLDCLDITATENNPSEPNFDVTLPQRVVLHAAAPNPFNPVTTISFTLPWPQHVDLAVFDVRGRQLAQLLSRDCDAGRHHLRWNGLDRDGRPLSSGTYLVRLRTETDQRTQKVLLTR